jgi:hypothetical protein
LKELDPGFLVLTVQFLKLLSVNNHGCHFCRRHYSCLGARSISFLVTILALCQLLGHFPKL